LRCVDGAAGWDEEEEEEEEEGRSTGRIERCGAVTGGFRKMAPGAMGTCRPERVVACTRERTRIASWSLSPPDLPPSPTLPPHPLLPRPPPPRDVRSRGGRGEGSAGVGWGVAGGWGVGGVARRGAIGGLFLGVVPAWNARAHLQQGSGAHAGGRPCATKLASLERVEE